jgi:lysophospholipase L1-like esterase
MRQGISRPLKIILANIILLAVTLLIALCAGEGLLRYRLEAWPFQPDIYQAPFLTEKDDNLRWRMPSEGKDRNSLGLRNREVGPKGENDFRILFLGDSLIFSSETTSGALYTAVIEEKLNALIASGEIGADALAGKEVEVINAGVPGYTTYQEIEFFNQYALDMQPDVVVLGVVFNDVYYKYLHRPTKTNFLAMDPESRRNRFDKSTFPGTVFAKSYLAHEVVYALEILHQKLGFSPYYGFERHEDFALAWKSYGWRDTESLIRNFQLQLIRQDIPLMMVIFPVSDQVDDAYLSMDRDYVLYPQARVKAFGARYKIPYLDLTDVLYQSGGRELFSDYLHLGGSGNDIVAAELTGYLSENILSGQ